MLDNLIGNAKEKIRLVKMQAEMKKQLENIFATYEKGKYAVVIRGDHHIERISVDGEEDKLLKSIINDAMKDLEKKIEKQMRGKLAEFGL